MVQKQSSVDPKEVGGEVLRKFTIRSRWDSDRSGDRHVGNVSMLVLDTGDKLNLEQSSLL